jgi:hypothetical protein
LDFKFQSHTSAGGAGQNSLAYVKIPIKGVAKVLKGLYKMLKSEEKHFNFYSACTF